MNDKQGDSLVAAIEGNFAGMSHGDLVLTCEMLTRGRAAWQKECEEAHAVLDDPECLIIRNEKDGYPEGRPDRTLTLAERVRALLRMKVDYKRWMTSAEQERDSLRTQNEALTKERSETASAIVKNIKELADLRSQNRELRELLQTLHDQCLVPDYAHDAVGTCKICRLLRKQALAQTEVEG